MLNKKIIESASVVVLAAVLSVVGIANNLSANTVVAQETSTEIVTENTEASLTAGASEAFIAMEDDVDVEREDVGTVTASEEAVEYTEEEQLWMTQLMTTAEDSLNVRETPDAEGTILGKLHAGDVATIVEAGDTWTKITSGNVEGYVLNEYCVFGLDALAYANETVDTIATVTTDGLRLRDDMSTDSAVITAVSTGYELTVDKEAEVTDGWVAVVYGGDTCYVTADYVELSLDLGTASTLEEEYAAALAAQEAARQEAARQAGSSSNQTSGSRQQGSSLAASTDDLTLLAAIVMCEAGNCSYEGQLAVASVVCNRVKSGTYPSTVYAVIYQSGQFGPASSGKLERTLASGNISASCYSAAAEALAGVDNTDGAIGFCYASSGRAGVVYGSVVFFK